MDDQWTRARVAALITPRGMLDRIVIARTFHARFIGLLGHSTLNDRAGLLFVPGGSIHTLGMRLAIDVVFLSEHLEVLDVAAHVQPWRFVFAPRRTRFVLELRAEVAWKFGIACGSVLRPVANRKQLLEQPIP